MQKSSTSSPSLSPTHSPKWQSKNSSRSNLRNVLVADHHASTRMCDYFCFGVCLYYSINVMCGCDFCLLCYVFAQRACRRPSRPTRMCECFCFGVCNVYTCLVCAICILVWCLFIYAHNGMCGCNYSQLYYVFAHACML